ncbi:hypothetical protein KEG38_27325 [Polyangium jinanense]|uniref:hypothetical protein n=1 Tax=Polyangium jinanense TaxID=2829994 RepID=UPI0023414921|nr:hypothetical protein [Polyangium jinanense]MDC3957600.1 hypothetical protein [Polyangium jinanense]
MNDIATQTPAPERANPSPRVRIDVISTVVQRALPNGVRMEIRPQRPVTAAWDQALPLFEGWMQSAELRVRVSGLTDSPFFAALEIEGAKVGSTVAAAIGAAPGEAGAGTLSSFSVELVVPLALLAPHAGKRCALRLVLSPQSSLAGGRKVTLARAIFVGIPGYGPLLSALDLLESTDSVLVDAPERRLFDLQNPEEGLWIGTGKWRLRLFADWAKLEGEPFVIDTKPSHVVHRFQRDDDAPAVVVEDATRRAGGRRTYTELVLDSSHPDLLPIPEEGKDVPFDLTVEHALTYGEHTGICTWHAALPVRLRDPRPLLKSFQRLSAVGIDFGTTSTVAALYQKGYRALLRLGSGSAPASKSAENPTYLLVEDHERLWAEVERAAAGDARFPNLLRIVRGSHAAREAMTDSPSAVVGELKSLPERVLSLDQSPQLRDRERRRDFLLDENRVRILVRAYAYLLSRAINRPGQDVYLRYWLTHPAKFDERARKLLEEEIRRGILLGIPEGIPAEEVVVEMSASEPEAFAAEVCPELATYAELEPVISKFGEMRFAVFDFGGGTLDIACGRFRPATEQEAEELGSRTVIETLQVSGDDHLGGDYLTHELVWLTHQHDKHLPEMEEKEVPMMRPQTVPPNNLANKPHLYKRSLAGRQNRFRFERELGLEAVKFAPEHEPRRAADLSAARLDGSEVRLESLATDVPALHAKLTEHLQTRIRDGVKLMKSMLAIAPWGTDGDWREQGVTILLAGNSSRSAFVEQALADELGIPGLTVWRPGSSEPFQQVVLYETPQRTERGVTIVGVTPKTAVALGALKIANREVHLVRRAQGFSYFVGDLRGFPPKFVALVQMGTPVADPSVFGPHYVDFGKWDTKTPLRVSQEYVAGKMTSNDPRVSMIPTGLAAGLVGRLFVCVSGPDELTLALQRDGQDPLVTTLNLAKYMR